MKARSSFRDGPNGSALAPPDDRLRTRPGISSFRVRSFHSRPGMTLTLARPAAWFWNCRPLPDEFDAERFAAAPNHFAPPARPRVAREGEPQPARQHAAILHRDLRAGRGHIVHDALARRKAAVEGDPSGLLHRFARCSFLRCGHFLLPAENALGTSLPHGSFKNRCDPVNAVGAGVAGLASFCRKNPLSRGLPGRANATIRSPATRRAASPRPPGGTAPVQPQGIDLSGVFVLGFKAKRRCCGRNGRGEAGVFAPFVYRLGRHPFTVERAVRFR